MVDFDQIEDRTGHPTQRIIKQHKKHLINAASNNHKMGNQFPIQQILKKENKKKMFNLHSSKAC